MADHELTPFHSDGCSCAPDLDIKECCIEHDRAYHRGGTEAERHEADMVFRECITTKGYWWIAWLYYFAVRIGGHPRLRTRYRWGFGRIPSCYKYDKPS